MSRNEIFIMLACVFAAAIMSGPLPIRHSPLLSSFSLASATSGGEAMADASMLQHSFDHQ